MKQKVGVGHDSGRLKYEKNNKSLHLYSKNDSERRYIIIYVYLSNFSGFFLGICLPKFLNVFN